MALIPCSECGKEISDKASACPHCGAPVASQVAPAASTLCSECGKEISDKAGVCPNCGAPVAPPVAQAAPPKDNQTATPKDKKKIAKWKVALGIFLFFVVIIALAGNDEKKPADGSDPAKSSSAEKKAEPAPKPQGEKIDLLSAEQLWGAFAENEVAAEKKYMGKTVAIEGFIHSIETSFMGYPEIVFDIQYGIQTVRCQFPKKSSDLIAEMKKDQRVIIIGKVTGFTLGTMLSLEDCRFGERK